MAKEKVQGEEREKMGGKLESMEKFLGTRKLEGEAML